MKKIIAILLLVMTMSCKAEVYEVGYDKERDAYVVQWCFVEWRRSYFYTQEGAQRFAHLKDPTYNQVAE